MARKCTFTGKRPNAANKVSHSHHKTKKRQLPNIQAKRLWWAEGDTWIRIRLSTRSMRSIDKLGLQIFADRCGVDLTRYACAS